MGEILIGLFGIFLAKKTISFGLYSAESQHFQVLCFIASLWRHTFTDFHDIGINATMVPNNYTFGVSISSSQYIRHDGGSSIAAHTIIKNSTTEVWAHGILKDSASGLVEFLHPPPCAKYLVPYEARRRSVAPHGILKNYDNNIWHKIYEKLRA